ncbi:MAG: hypothetical protein WEB53_09915 [Akkermansiaceae bacterium]
MQFLSSERIPPAADIREVAREIQLTPSERKTIEAAIARLRAVGDIAGQHCKATLQSALWAASAEFEKEPTAKTAAAVAQAAAILHASEIVDGAFSASTTTIRTAVSKSLEPVATALLDRAASVMAEQLAKIQASLDSAPQLRAEARIFGAKVSAADDLVASQGEMLKADPLSWLLQEIAIEL